MPLSRLRAFFLEPASWEFSWVAWLILFCRKCQMKTSCTSFVRQGLYSELRLLGYISKKLPECIRYLSTSLNRSSASHARRVLARLPLAFAASRMEDVYWLTRPTNSLLFSRFLSPPICSLGFLSSYQIQPQKKSYKQAIISHVPLVQADRHYQI